MIISKKAAEIKITWEKEDKAETEKAKKFFEKMTRQGWIAAVHDGELRRILEFTPKYGEMWFIPLVEGG
jgi:hypothetical protein